MAKKKDVYRCSVCGAQAFQWHGQCPGCHEWNTLELCASAPAARGQASPRCSAPVPLAEVSTSASQSFPSGIQALDRILGNGLVPGSSILVGGEPGIGKSTLLLQVCGSVASRGLPALYASGEESLPQIKARAERLGVLSPSLMAVATSRVEDVLDAIEASAPALLILDSVQTMASAAAEGLPGNVSQVRAVATALCDACRNSGATLVLVGHVTKDGTLAGPRLLEHMVDTVISLEGDRRQMFRLLRVFKNRFGPNEELLVFQMRQKGMEVVADPSTFFLEARDPSLSGTALVMGVDGHRPLVVETQALVNRTYMPIPSRTPVGLEKNRLNVLLAVLEKRLKLNFGQVDVYAKVCGGIKMSEPGLDLALVAAILSSYYDYPLPEKGIFWGEVDLNGQIRPVAAHAQRLAQATRLGFSPIVFPAGSGDAAKGAVATLADLQRLLFRRKT